MLLLTLRGTPTLYYGDEIGMSDGIISAENQQDPAGIRVPGMGRDPCRKPMQWTAEKNAGFSPPNTQHLWLPLGEDHQQVNVDLQIQDPGSLLNLYRQLLAYRKESPALQWGRYLPVEDTPEECYVYLRNAADRQTLLVALNFSLERVNLKFPNSRYGNVHLSTHLDRTGSVDLSDWYLRGNEGVLIELEDNIIA